MPAGSAVSGSTACNRATVPGTTDAQPDSRTQIHSFLIDFPFDSDSFMFYIKTSSRGEKP
jgi:hypothetical protein